MSLEENLSSITTHKLTHFYRSAVHFAIYFLQPRRRHLTSEMAYRLRTLLNRRYQAFDTQYESLGEPIPGGPQLHCRFVVQSSQPALFGVVCKYWAPKISGSFRFRLLTAEARCEKMRAGKADRYLVQAVTQDCECEAVGHQTISANPSSWHHGGNIPQGGGRASVSGCATVLLLELSAIGSAARGASEKAAHLVVESLKLCRVV